MAISFFFAMTCCGESPLLICVPGGQSPGRIDSVFSRVLAPVPVMGFQRIKDLDEVLPTYPGSPVIGSVAYVRYLPGYSIMLQGKKGQHKQKKFLIISGNQAITRANVETIKIGVLDFLGREKMPGFVKDAFGLSLSKLKRVSKKEDLQSLLGMELVDAAIIEESDLAEMKADTKLKLFIVMESKPMDSFPVFACSDTTGCLELRNKLSLQPKAVLQSLTLEGWE